MKYRSKIDLWYHIVHVLLAALVLRFVVTFSSDGNAAAGVLALAMFLCEIYISLMLGSCRYVLEESGLLVCHWPRRKLRVPYENITSAEETRQARPFSALSADALEVRYRPGGSGDLSGEEKTVIISPEKKKEFLERLGERMPRQ